MPRFHNGQTVICVRGGENPNAGRRYPGLRWPVKGRRYTIRNAEIPHRGKWTFVLVNGISNRVITWPCGSRFEAGFHEDRFEPATDISDLKRAEKSHEIFTDDPNPDWDRRVKRKVRKKEDA